MATKTTSGGKSGRPAGHKLSQSEFETLQRKIGNQMRQQSNIHADLLKCVSAYKGAVESIAQTSSDLAQAITRLGVYTISAHQFMQDYHMQTCNSASLGPDFNEKQKNLGFALQQIVRFHTAMAQQQHAVAATLASDFERPLSMNLTKFKDIANGWDKQVERDLKQFQHDIKIKEQQATKHGKKPNGDMDKLSGSLYELSKKVNEMEKSKFAMLDSALLTNQYQTKLVAHHLQRVLKAEVQACRSTYHRDGIVKNAGSPAKNTIPIGHHLQLNVSPLEHRNDFSDEHPQPPPRRSSEESGRGASIRQSRMSRHLPAIRERNQQERNAPKRPQNPHRRTIIGNPVNMEEAQNLINQNFVPPPEPISSPTNSNEHFQQPPSATLIKPPPAITQMHPMIREKDRPLFESIYTVAEEPINHHQQPNSNHSEMHDQQNRLEYIDEHSESSTPRFPVLHATVEPDNIQESPELFKEKDLALVIYDFIGTEADELNVLEGDVISIAAIEGEWAYAILMQSAMNVLDSFSNPLALDEEKYEPAFVDNKLQMGWVPLSFMTPLNG